MPDGNTPLSVMMRRLPVILAATALLGACTPMRWDHPAFGPEQTVQEASECRQQAWLESQRQPFMYDGWRYPRYVRGADGRIRAYASPYYMMNDRYFDEMRLADFCMRSKGFRLVPAT